MQMHDLKVYLVGNAKVQLEDDFVDKEDDLRHYFYGVIKGISKQAGMILTNGQFLANVKDADQNDETKTIKLKEFNLDEYALESDPDWLPENMDPDDADFYKLRVGDKTWSYLVTYFKLYQARVTLFNDSLDKEAKKDEKKTAVLAKCQEQIIHDVLIGPAMEKIQAAMDKELEAEFTEVYKPKSEKAAEKKKQRSGKKNK